MMSSIQPLQIKHLPSQTGGNSRKGQIFLKAISSKCVYDHKSLRIARVDATGFM